MKWMPVLTLAAMSAMVAAGTVSQPAWAAPNDHPTKVAAKSYKTLPGGLKYAILKPGKGAAAKKGQQATVHYTGWLQSSGEKFDSSLDRGQPFTFPLGAGQVIKGWDQGVVGMKIGEKRQLVIPASMGYGPQGSPPKIPGGATLVFDVELLGAK